MKVLCLYYPGGIEAGELRALGEACLRLSSQVALREGVQLYGLKGALGNCGGSGQCITCFVEVPEGQAGQLDPGGQLERADQLLLAPGVTLAGRAVPHGAPRGLSRQVPPTRVWASPRPQARVPA